jgi:[acyl-carrier-protein] S-malonyltransferase
MEILVCEEPICPLLDCRVISGHLGALQFFWKNFSKHHFRCTRMWPASGSIHTPFMELTVESQVLEMIDTRKLLNAVQSTSTGIATCISNTC